MLRTIKFLGEAVSVRTGGTRGHDDSGGRRDVDHWKE